MKSSIVLFSLCGLLLPSFSIAQTSGDLPSIQFFEGDLHRDLSAGNPQEIPPVLRPSPEFVIHLANGKQLLLSSFQGKVVALVFVHTTCPICQEASRVFTKLYAEYRPRGFEPLGVAFNSGAYLYVHEFSKKFGIDYPIGFSSLGDVMHYLGLPADQRFTIPQIVWIDRNGDIRAQTPVHGNDEKLAENSWRNTIELLLNEPSKSEE